MLHQMRTDWCSLLTHGLDTAGYAVIRDFLNPFEIATLKAHLLQRFQMGHFKAASIGQGPDLNLQPEIRGDQTCWLDQGARVPEEAELWARLEQLRICLNRELQLGLWDVEAHFALYPPGARYQRHLDRFRNDDARTISVVLYLNESWQTGDGGELVIYGTGTHSPPVPAQAVGPKAGTLVCFLSEHIEHEVLPSQKQRLSVAAWMRKRALNPR